ncbi:MAG: hypothetical protein VXZ89_07435 [Candidatus Thermoplasmatota archaeon]|nr:hypothetical protein [Candidatus Thermoplasmatota archaeon]
MRRVEEWDVKDELTCQKAIERFDLSPRPMGIPTDIDPPPKTIHIDWPVNPIPIEVQKNVGKKIVKRGEFGLL